MTLKDTQVIADGDINQDEAQIENQLLREQAKARAKLSKQEQGPTLLGKYDDEEKENEPVRSLTTATRKG